MASRNCLTSLATFLAIGLPKAYATTFGAEKGLVVLNYAAYRGEYVSGGDYYNYTNIRYAAPPTGLDRFKAPRIPLDFTDKGVQTAQSDGHNCMQLLIGGYDVPNQHEDCLFLDVLAPARATPENPLPVIVYLYGDAFSQGYKGLYPGDGLLKASGNNVVYVVPNFRGGIFGFLPGQAVEDDGDLNAGLLDQALALRWVKQYIHLFGGDSESVTVLGSDSGATSILHHITAKEGRGNLTFHRAVLQSPIYVPLLDGESTFENVLALTKTKSLGELRQASTAVLLAASQQITRTTKWRPVVDRTYVTDIPTRLLNQHKYHAIPLIISRTRDEGQKLMPRGAPFIPIDSPAKDDASELFSSFLKQQGFNLSASAEAKAAVFYPPIDRVAPTFYKTIFGRYTVMLTEAVSACYGRTFNVAKDGYIWNILFNQGQGFHFDDTSYYFDGSALELKRPMQPVGNKTIAALMQSYLVNFATTDDPNRGPLTNLPHFNQYESAPGLQTLNLGDKSSAYGVKDIRHIKDPLASEHYAVDRCKFWADEAWR